MTRGGPYNENNTLLKRLMCPKNTVDILCLFVFWAELLITSYSRQKKQMSTYGNTAKKQSKRKVPIYGNIKTA